MLIVLTTCSAPEVAEALAEQIVEARLYACVQVLPNVTSVYVWEGELQKESEVLLLIKTLPETWEALRDFITENHSYDVPEIVAVESEKISGPYGVWLNEVLNDKPPRRD